MFKRPLATTFALLFSLCVLILDFTAPGPATALSLYGWAAVAFAAVLLVVGVQNWLNTKSFVRPGILRPREAAFFISGLVASASIVSRAMASLPLANTYAALPNWPSLYLAIFLLVVAAGAFYWLSGRALLPWALFVLLVLAAVNGQLFKLADGGWGVFFGFSAAAFFFQNESLTGGKPRLSYVGGALIIFIVAAFASLLWSQDWGGSFRTVYFLANGFLIFAILARHVEAADVLVLPAALVWAILLTEIVLELALAAKFAMVWRWIPPNIPGENLFWTMGVSRNAISTYFVAALPLLILSAKSARPAAPRWLLWTQVALSIAVPALTLSKSGVLGLLVVLWFAFSFWGPERRMNLKLLASAAVVAIVVLVLLVVLFLPGGPARFLNPRAYTTHLVTFKLGFEALRGHLLTGVGLGSDLAWVGQARALSPDEMVAVPEHLVGRSHSFVAEAAGTMGLLGLVAFFILIQTAAWAGANLVRIEGDRFFFGMVSASLAGAGAILTVAFGLAELSIIPVMVLVGLAMYEGGIRRRGLGASAPTWLTVVFSVMVVLGSVLGLSAVASEQDLERGAERRRMGDFDGAVRCFKRAAAFAPWSAAPHERLAEHHLTDERGDLLRALDAYRAASRRSRGNAAYLERCGLLSWVFGDDGRASAYLARAVDADPAGLVGGSHQPSYALVAASRGDTAAARRALTEAVLVDPLLAGSVAFVSSEADGALRTYLRVVPRGAARPLREKLAFSLCNVRGYEARSFPRLVPDVPAAYRRDLCLEDVYAAEFREKFVADGPGARIAGAAAYRLGEGYAETRLRSNVLFRDLKASGVIPPGDPGVGLALFPSSRPDVEERRWELQSLLGMALLAESGGRTSALPEITAAFEAVSEKLLSDLPPPGAATEADVDRLSYYALTEEKPAWDLALADALLARDERLGARRYYARGLTLLVAGEADVRDVSLRRAVTGVLKCDALAALAGAEAGEGGLPYVREPSPAAFVADAYAEEFYGDYKRALTRYRDGLSRYPHDVGLLTETAEFYRRRGLRDKALELLAGDGAPRDLALLRRRAEITWRGGDAAGSLTQYRAIERDYPGDLVTYLAEARLYGDEGRWEGEAAAFERARSRIPPGSLWESRYAAALFARGDVEDAAARYARARELNPFDLEPYVVWGEELCRLGRPEEGLRLLRGAVRVDPDSTWARRALAAAYEKPGRFADAERTYEEGVGREGLGSPITLAYDDFLKRRGDDEARRRVLDAALKRDPANATLYERLGELALASGEAERGLKLLSAAVTLEPAAPGANAALGFYYRTHGRAGEAVPFLERARAAAPGAAPYRVLLADAYVETGRPRDALAELDAVDDPAHLAKALALRAKAYYNLGDREAASAAARRALELDPALAEAKTYIAE